MDGHALLERLAAEPRLAALFFDLDGVLAPIVARPEDGAVPAETRRELERLVGRYALVAVVTGRDGEDARARAGVEGIVYVGSHGLELEPDAEAWAERLQAFAATVDWPLERKRLTVAFHYRTRGGRGGGEARRWRPSPSAPAPRASSRASAARCSRCCRRSRRTRAPRCRTCWPSAGSGRALYAGDDTTDLDGFRALEGLELGGARRGRLGRGPAGAARGGRPRRRGPRRVPRGASQL